MHSRATDRRSASKCQGKWPDQTLDQAFGLPEVLVAVSTSRLSCKRAGKTRTLMPVWDSSGESRLKAAGDEARSRSGSDGAAPATARRPRRDCNAAPHPPSCNPGAENTSVLREPGRSRQSPVRWLRLFHSPLLEALQGKGVLDDRS